MTNTVSIVIVALLVGMFLAFSGYLWHSRSARRTAARDAEGSAPAWSATELVAMMGAVGTLLAAVGTFYTTIQTQKGVKVKAALAARDSARTELTALRDSTRRLFHFDSHTWDKLPVLDARPVAGSIRVDDRFLSGDCDRHGAPTVYDATGPARLRCAKGKVHLQLSAPTVILLVPGTGN